MRVFEFAKLIDVPARELVNFLQKNGYTIKSHMSLLSDEAFLFLDKEFNKTAQPPSSMASAPQVTSIQPSSEPEVNLSHEEISPPPGLVVRAMTVHDLATRINKPIHDIIVFLLRTGIVAAKNDVVSNDVVKKIAHHFEIPLAPSTASLTNTVRERQEGPKVEKSPSHGEPRSPVVVVVGHVDHGKTTLLDYIRKTRVALREKGGITQHLGAYEANTSHGSVVFIDTPGHEAFPKMRERGMHVADLAVLVIAADDGIKPQTVEAIKQLKETNVPVIVAINKMDKVDPSRADIVKRELAHYDLLPEDWGGSVICVPIAAKTGLGVDHLLEMLVLQAQLMELKAVSAGPAQGYILESKIEKGRGPVATVIIQTGTAKRGDYFTCGSIAGRISSLVDSSGQLLLTVGPAKPVQIAGFSALPHVGDLFIVGEKDNLKAKQKELLSDGIAHRVMTNKQGNLNLIVKADSNSSREALLDALDGFSRKLHQGFTIVSSGVGPVSSGDVERAATTGARIVTLHVRSDANALMLAQKKGVTINHYDIIYRLLDDLTNLIESNKPATLVRTKIGEAMVRKVFDIKGVGVVAGSYLREGRFIRNGFIVAYRGRQKIGEGKITSLQRDKKIVKEVHAGFEFGFVVDALVDWHIDDRVECYMETTA